MSSHSVVSLSSFNILFFTQVLTVLTSSIKYHEYVTDKGKNISIPCTAEGNVMWVKESGNNSTIIQTGKFLVLTNVSTDERGLYVCFAAVPPRHASTPDTGSTAQATNEQRKSITASLPTYASPSSAASSLILTTTSSSSSANSSSSSSSSLSEDVNVSTMVNVSATNASTTSSLPMPAPTIAAATATATIANTNTKTENISTAQHYSMADKATTTLNNSGQTMEVAPTPDTARNTEADKDDNGDRSAEDVEAEEYQAVEKVNLTVRTPPGPVTQLYFKASTILGFLIWRFNKTNSGGYPVRSFTAEFRNVSYNETPYNQSFEHEWSRMDPINIAPNVRQMEVYRLEPNTTYEFRIWANNQLGSGEVVTTNVTTLPETKEEDLIRLIQPDLDNFDPRIWIIAVSVVLGTLVILAIGLCIVLSKECYQSSQAGTNHNTDTTNTITNNTNYTTTNTTTSAIATRNVSNADAERNLNAVVMA